MPPLPRARDRVERMDAPDVDPRRLETALDRVAASNRWFGARRALLRHLDWVLPRDRSARLLDVGTGAADLPIAMARWARQRGRTVAITAVDRHPTTARVASRRAAMAPGIRVLAADGLRLPFPTGTFHAGILSMTLHHMDGPDLVGILRELGRVARGGRVLVAELERRRLHLLGARALAATLWRHDPVTRHDAPLSVRRSFTPEELRELAGEAGLQRPVAHRHPFFRLVLRACA